ncbi:pyruvate kinase [Mycolicibacterium goodii]|uniref:Pyruvate kinase n=1 Tax=Mycolicibacterium goodii TaxID=134601 RepID=A0A0K0X2V2_MYCGD|nr:pyruvate kinase [Mycolicibacterium goodii]
MTNRRAKIVCTLGPATATAAVLTDLVDAGMDVARLNFSHSTRAEHSALYGMVRQAAAERGRVVGVLADLQGPKIRLGSFEHGPVVWATGEQITITTAPCPGDHDRVSTTYPGLSGDVQPGDRLLVDDGRVDLRVVEVDGPDIRCDVVDGGPVSDHKGISLPDVPVSVPPLSDKDIDDLKFALVLGADMIAMSFVRAPEEVKLAHAIMDEVGRRVPVIAKLEKPEAVSDLPAIVEAFDGIMVARGDLGVEMPLEQIPLVQRRAIALCRQAAKPVIVATQMLDSMVSDRRPTRAEVSDVANAVFDGADAVMLSAETSVGADPAHAVATMSRIVVAAESGSGRGESPESRAETVPGTDAVFGDAIAVAACEVGRRLGAAALCCFTRTGDTALRLARQRSALPLLAFAHDEEVQARLAFTWGVESAVLAQAELAESMPGEVSRALLSRGACERGDVVVVVSGSRSGVAGYTDSVRVLRVE